MPLFGPLHNFFLGIVKALFAGPEPPNQLLSVGLSEHVWWGIELRNCALRTGNVELSTRQASCTLPWFFERKLAFKGETLGDVSGFLASCRYVDDMDQFRRPEWWIHPVEFEELKRGDCEDHALWAWRVLHDMGHDVRLMLGLCRGVGHAWVQLYVDEESYVLEATAKHDVPASNASDYVPEHSFRRMDNGSFVMFGHKPQVIDAAKRTPTSPLTLRGPDRQRLRRQDDPAESTSADPLTLREHWVEIDRLIFAGKKTEAHRAIRIAVQGKGSYTRQFLDRYFYLREQQPDSFELDDEAYWEDWKV